MDDTAISARVEALLGELTLDERALMTAGSDVFALKGAARLGIPDLVVTDGPNGARGSSMFGSGEARAVCVPCGSALGATWDPELIEQIGEMLGDDARTKRARMLLAPTVNLHRSPLGGRNFECYSEDPLLSGKIAAAFVRGVQSRGVATTVKHFVGNEAETERQTMSSVIDERTLRELYLVPFELAVREGRSLGIMTAYNRLNGIYCTEDAALLEDILRGDWGFEGIVMTDWFGAVDTVNSAVAGLDIEMPGPGRGFGVALAEAVRQGRVAETRLDELVRRQLLVLGRLGALDDEPGPESSIDLPAHRALARRAASESIVLLKNDGDVLPLDLGGSIRKLAVIGPNSARTQLMGGGSANLRPMYRTSVLASLQELVGDDVEIVHEAGCDIDRNAPSLGGPGLRAPNGEQGFTVDIFGNARLEGAPAGTTHRESGRLMFMSAPAPGLDPSNYSFRATGMWHPAFSGPHRFEMVQLGSARVFVDGVLVLDGMTNPPGRGTAYFGMGSAPMIADVVLREDTPVPVVVEFHSTPGTLFAGVDLGCRTPMPDDPIDAAVAAAKDADAVVLVVGTNDDWESEGEDRTFMELPGDQDELVSRVLAANPRTAVVVNTGSPVTMDWSESSCAVLQAWFGGQESGNAIVDVLRGAAEPAGRLPMTLPVRLEHNPSYGNFPGESSEVRYGEGVLVGYRWYQSRRLPTRFPFGHGLSYTTFTVGEPAVSASTFVPGTGASLTVTANVTNTGDRRGAHVVQCYVSAPRPAGGVTKPDQELRAFSKVWLEPGEARQVTMTLTDRAFAHWEPGDRAWAELQTRLSNRPTVAMADRNATPGWRVDAGDYRVQVGTSSEAIVGSATVTVAESVLLPRDA